MEREKISSITGIDHIGYAVKDIEASKALFELMGFHFDISMKDELRNVMVSIGRMERGGAVELLSPAEGVKSPVDGYLKKMGNTPYHICYKVKNIYETALLLQKKGFTLLTEPDKSVPLCGTVCFLYSPQTGIIELVEYEN